MNFTPFPLLLMTMLLVSVPRIAKSDSDGLNDPEVQKTLRAMKDTSTWYHPDLFGEFTGLRYYAHREFAQALKYLEIGAYYADKLSQLSIGLMHMNGEGTPKDPVTALAWFDIAAERNYPNFVQTRDRLKATMSPQQIADAIVLRTQLALRYADVVAKPRMAMQLRQGLMQITGSHTGFNFGISELSAKPKPLEIPIGGGGDRFAKERWDPDSYFKARDAEWKATVTVGELGVSTAADQSPDARSSSNLK